MFKHGVFSGPYFPVFGLNIGKYGPEKFPYFDTFHAVWFSTVNAIFRSLKKQEEKNIYRKNLTFYGSWSNFGSDNNQI